MALPPIKNNLTRNPLQGLTDIESTHLNKTNIYICPPMELEKIGFFYKLTNETLNKLLDINNYSLLQANLEVLPDDIVRKTDLNYQQGETIYMRIEETPLTQFADVFTENNKTSILPFMIISDTLQIINDKIDIFSTPIYMISHALTKNNAYPMKRFYCIRNDNYIKSLL